MTLPNLITIVRIIIIPPFLWVYLTAKTQGQFYLSALLLIISGISDFLDGYFARKFKQTSKLGIVLDPIADKLTLAAVIVSLWIKMPMWYPLYIILILKDVFMGIGGVFLMAKKKEISGSKWFGKITTALFYAITIFIIACPNTNPTVITVLLCLLVVWAFFAFIMYVPVFLKIVRGTENNK